MGIKQSKFRFPFFIASPRGKMLLCVWKEYFVGIALRPTLCVGRSASSRGPSAKAATQHRGQ